MATSLRTVSQLRVRVLRDEQLKEDLRTDPETALARLDIEPVPDTWIYRIVVGSLGLVVLLCVIGAIVLSAMGKTAPELLIALGSAAVGALAGLLAPSPAGAT